MEKIAKHTLNPTRNRRKVFSVGFALLLFSVSLALPAVVQAASLYFFPSSGSYSVGRSFTVSVYVSSPSQAMNAVSGIITFPSDKLQVTSLSKAGSIVSFWAQEPSFSNITGTITLEGVVLPAGYIGSNGKILDVNFAAKSQGTASLNFSSGSVLAHDGQGTNILAGLGSASYTITGVTTTKAPSTTQTTIPKTPKAVKISSETHPDSDKWYSAGTATFSWDLTNDITEVRLLISKYPDAVPTISYSPPVNSKTVTNLGKGVWYFYVQLKNDYGWGEISRFRLQIDNSLADEVDSSLAKDEEEIEEIEEITERETKSLLLAFIDRKDFSFWDLIAAVIIALAISHSIASLILRQKYLAKIKFLKRELSRETNDVRTALFEAFDNLRKETTKQIAKLDGNAVLSKREEGINEELKKAIRNSEIMIDGKLEKTKRKINGD